MESKGPYKVEQFGARNRNEFVVVGPGWEKVCEIYTRSGAEKAALYSNISYAEGRKAAESYTEKMLKFATDEVRKCHEEIRRLEDKYARNFYRMPISLDEELAKKARGIE